jgi:threonine synthase
MQYYSTKNPTGKTVSLKEAVLKGLPDDNGLFMPCQIETLPENFFKYIDTLSFYEMAWNVVSCLDLQAEVPPKKLCEILKNSLNFDAPLVDLDQKTGILELFHGNTLAFKDFGARFMAQLMAYFVEGEKQTLHILVATSGDTGSAVAHGFLGVPNIHVTVLYPSGKVSNRQEKQFTTLGENITALEVAGTFDDCQHLVKQAFLDTTLTKEMWLSSANSINIARLIPQMFYYFRAYAQAKAYHQSVVFAVPSGNFGNLTAGLFAKRMGLPVHKFVAATNVNDVVPAYLRNGNFQPRPSVQTISNAMDVGNPSNFARMKDLYENSLAKMQEHIAGYAFEDSKTLQAIAHINQKYAYVIEPHGAVAYLALEQYRQESKEDFYGVVLETAHPVKFPEAVEPIIQRSIEIPERLRVWTEKPKLSIPLRADFQEFKAFLLDNKA